MNPNRNKPNMMMNTTLNQLRSLRLETMAQALELQFTQSGISAMSFEERLALLVDREVHGRQDRHCARLLKLAKLKYPACRHRRFCRVSEAWPRKAVSLAASSSSKAVELVRCGHG